MGKEGSESVTPVTRTPSPRESAPPPGNEEKGTHLRFLLSNSEAGCIMGKGGSTIQNIKSQSGARVRLSRYSENFPGTPDRIIMVSGTVEEILKAVDLVFCELLDKFCTENEDGGEADLESYITVVVPHRSCGRIIGKGGAIIRSLIEDSRADIRICPKDINYPDLRDRLVTVTGTLEEQMDAIELILLKLEMNPYYQQSSNAVFPYPGIISS